MPRGGFWAKPKAERQAAVRRWLFWRGTGHPLQWGRHTVQDPDYKSNRNKSHLEVKDQIHVDTKPVECMTATSFLDLGDEPYSMNETNIQ